MVGNYTNESRVKQNRDVLGCEREMMGLEALPVQCPVGSALHPQLNLK